MAVTVKSATLWRREVENRPGALASTLEPLAKAGVDLRVVMGYRLPGAESRAMVLRLAFAWDEGDCRCRGRVP